MGDIAWRNRQCAAVAPGLCCIFLISFLSCPCLAGVSATSPSQHTTHRTHTPSTIPQAVLVATEVIPDTPPIKGWDFNKGCDLDGIMGAMLTTGFQATTFGQAIHEVNRMVSRGTLGRLGHH